MNAYGFQLKSWVEYQVDLGLLQWREQLQSFEAQLRTLADAQDIQSASLATHITQLQRRMDQLDGETSKLQEFLRCESIELDVSSRLRELSDGSRRVESTLSTHQDKFELTNSRLASVEHLLSSLRGKEGELELSFIRELPALTRAVEVLKQGLEDCRLDIYTRLNEVQARTAESMESLKANVLKTCRLDLAAAFRSEANAVVALDAKLQQQAPLAPPPPPPTQTIPATSTILSPKRLVYERYTAASKESPLTSPSPAGASTPPSASRSRLLGQEPASMDRLALRVANW